ncbi:MAG: flagellar cap protein FliD N-terminal domain-containing protein, partial [Planctomycetota bacterium]
MSRISTTGVTTSQGLVTGIPIDQTVDQLMAISARPRNDLQIRTDGLQAERQAVDQLSARVLGLRGSLNSLNRLSTFNGRTATSSSESVVPTVASGQTPAVGSYRFTPLRNATSSQFVSAPLADIDRALDGGSFDVRVGGQLDTSARLSDLNGGLGFQQGRIQITDRQG